MIDTRTCKFCGVEFSKIKINEGTFDEGYCCKFHRKDHERQLIREGKMDDIPKLGEFAVMVDSTMRDIHGEPVYFPKVGGYYDKALGKHFETKKEKVEYMKEKKICMDGSSDPKHWPIEAGDNRHKSNRLK